jgi:hypothetical protein
MMYFVSIWMRCPSVWMPNPLGNRSLGRNADFRFLREIFRLMRFLLLKILPTVRAETTVPTMRSMPIDNPEATFCLLGKFVFPVG